MKILLTAILVSSTVSIIGCNKTNKNTLETTNDSPDMNLHEAYMVEVDQDGNTLVLNINGEEQIIDLSEFVGDLDLENIDGNIEIAVVASSQQDGEDNTRHSYPDGSHERGYEFEFELDSDDLPQGVQRMIQRYAGDGGEAQMHVIINGEVMGDMPEGMLMHMMGDEMSPEMMREMNERMMHGEGGPHPDMFRRSMQDEHGGEWTVDFPHEISEEEEFMHKVRLFYEIAEHLEASEAVAILGVHMLRDHVEPELRLELLEEIIDNTPFASASRNASILVAIQTCHELELQDEAAEYMAELVMSNTFDWEDHDDDRHDD